MSTQSSPLSALIQRRRWVLPLLHIALSAGALLFVFPAIWMLSTSLKPLEQTVAVPPSLIPKPFQWVNYRDMAAYIPFLRYTFNTLWVCCLSVVGSVVSSSLVAYSFTRLRWPGRELCFALMLATMMVPFPVVMVPLYSVFKALGWIGQLKPLWVPSFFASAFNIFLLRQFFLRIPKNLGEAASVEGASELRIFLSIYVPLAMPALAVVALFQFIASWNDFLGPLLFLTEQKDYTLALGLQFYQSQHQGTQWNLLMAASTLCTLPVLVLFFVFQKRFLEGFNNNSFVKLYKKYLTPFKSNYIMDRKNLSNFVDTKNPIYMCDVLANLVKNGFLDRKIVDNRGKFVYNITEKGNQTLDLINGN